MSVHKNIKRRKFILKSSLGVLGTGALTSMPGTANANPLATYANDNINEIGPKKGYTPQIGTLVSMLNWMRMVILGPVDGMSTKDLDYIHDDNANSIGAMLLHLGATERFYQLNTFDGRRWGDWPDKDSEDWNVASALGTNARETIKGHPLAYYTDKLETVREHTLKELAQRDDAWLMTVDESWGWGPTNNYCKWFHVCEHESNHNGQIKWLSSRLHTAD